MVTPGLRMTIGYASTAEHWIGFKGLDSGGATLSSQKKAVRGDSTGESKQQGNCIRIA